MSKISLHICATPWNFLNSFVFASNRPEETSYLMYVDYPEHEDNIYLEALKNMGDTSPFKKAWCFHGKYKGAWQKWRKRLKEIEQIKQLIVELKPDQVYVGSDRRIEFQCAMTEAVKHKPNVKGIYLDEGVFSYTCRKRSQTWRDRVLDTWIKRLMYPCDWKHPITIGASDWISEGWLLQPENACLFLKGKLQLNLIMPELYKHTNLSNLLRYLFPKSETILKNQYDALILLPHPSQLTSKMKQAYKQQVQAFNNVLIKAHPRNTEELDWLTTTADVLPALVPLELFLPQIQTKKVISSQSTTLLTTKLMRSDMSVSVIDPISSEFEKMLKKL